MYKEVSVFVPSICKSAGTLIACGAKNLVMTTFGELGPLDVQVLKRDEPGERRSGLVTMNALEQLKGQSFDLFEYFLLQIQKKAGEAMSFKYAVELASKISSEIMRGIYGNINLDGVGSDTMTLKVAKEYCERLNSKYKNLKNGAIDQLNNGYPAHDFVIDIQEALELFERVQLPDEYIRHLLDANFADMMVPRERSSTVKVLGPAVPERKLAGALMEQNGADSSGVSTSGPQLIVSHPDYTPPRNDPDKPPRDGL